MTDTLHSLATESRRTAPERRVERSRGICPPLKSQRDALYTALCAILRGRRHPMMSGLSFRLVAF